MKIQVVLEKEKLKSISVVDDKGNTVFYTVKDILLRMSLGDIIDMYSKLS